MPILQACDSRFGTLQMHCCIWAGNGYQCGDTHARQGTTGSYLSIDNLLTLG